MTNNKEKKGKEWGENVISHITFGFWQNIFHRSLARCTIASEWDSYVLPSPHPSHFWLLPVTVTTHTCKPDTLLSPPPHPLSTLVSIGSRYLQQVTPFLLKPLINSQASLRLTYAMQLKGFISKVFTDKRKIYVYIRHICMGKVCNT